MLNKYSILHNAKNIFTLEENEELKENKIKGKKDNKEGENEDFSSENNENDEDYLNNSDEESENEDDLNENETNKFKEDGIISGNEMDPDLYAEINKDKIALEKQDEEKIRIKEGAEFTLDSENGLFKVDQIQSGTEFSACKPWKGVVLNSVPSDYKPFPGESNEPDSYLELEFIHGYRCHDTRNNLRYTENGDIVYHSAAVGIVFNRESRTQKFFFDHIDDITSFAIHPNKKIIATGEVGPYPLIALWNSETMECIIRINGPLQKGINHLAFSKDGKYLVASAADDDHHISIFDWEKGCKNQENLNVKSKKQKATITVNPVFAYGKGPRANVMGLCFNNTNDIIAVPCVKEVNFVSFKDGGFKLKRGTGLKGNSLTTITCAEYMGNTLICGTFIGCLVLFSGTGVSKVIKAHEGTINSIYIRENNNPKNQGFLTGGNDCIICYWDSKFNIVNKINVIDLGINSLNAKVRSLCENQKGTILLGTRAGEIIEIVKNENPIVHVRGHFDKELWALVISPNEDKFFTAGEDKLLAVWDIKTRLIEKVNKILYFHS
jgi:WD40 repeat protein